MRETLRWQMGRTPDGRFTLALAEFPASVGVESAPRVRRCLIGVMLVSGAGSGRWERGKLTREVHARA